MDDIGSRSRLLLPLKIDLQSDSQGWSLAPDESAHKTSRVKTNFSINKLLKIIYPLLKCKSPNVHSLSEVHLTYPASHSSTTIAVFQANRLLPHK